jgi:desulfoferrodoxin (superoxide reductase-like protein)
MLLATVSVAILAGVVKVVRADVPSVLQVDNLSQGSTGKIKVQIRHLNPSGGHYVDAVEVDVAGQVKSFNLQAQNSNPFTVELELGQIQGSPNAKVQAHCNMHGWSDWSSTVQVPEFSEVSATVLAALAAALLIARRKRNR